MAHQKENKNFHSTQFESLGSEFKSCGPTALGFVAEQYTKERNVSWRRLLTHDNQDPKTEKGLESQYHLQDHTFSDLTSSCYAEG